MNDIMRQAERIAEARARGELWLGWEAEVARAANELRQEAGR